MAKPEWHSWNRDNVLHTVRLAEIVALKEEAPPETCSIYLRSGHELKVTRDVTTTIKSLLGATKS
jgi:hypothetical protein